MADEKSSSSGLVWLIAAGAAAFGGYKYYDSKHKVVAAESPGASARLWQDAPAPNEATDATARCLDALAGRCIETPCTLITATKVALARDPNNGADFAHDTLLEMCLNAKETDQPKAWAVGLLRRVKYRVIDGYRRSARVCTMDQNQYGIQLFIHSTTPGEQIEDADLQAALCSLKQGERCVIEGRYYEELSDVALAQKCGAPTPAAVRKQLQRARERLQLALAPAAPVAPKAALHGPKYPPPGTGWPSPGASQAYPGAAPVETGRLGGQARHD